MCVAGKKFYSGLLIATFLLTGCAEQIDPIPKHIHVFDKEIASEQYHCKDADCTHSATYFYSCECGEHGTETFGHGDSLGHTFNVKNVDDKYLATPADCYNSATYYYSCHCGEKGTETFEHGYNKPHEFTEKVAEPQYLAKQADCIHPAQYYYSCECGEHTYKTFEYGFPNGHSCKNECFTLDVIKNPTNDEKGIYQVICNTCGEIYELEKDSINKNEFIVLPYIETTGNEFIDTGFIPNYKTKVEFTGSIKADKNLPYELFHSIYGCDEMYNKSSFEIWINDTKYNDFTGMLGYGSKSYAHSIPHIDCDRKFTSLQNGPSFSIKYEDSNELIWDWNVGENIFSASNNMYLFSTNRYNNDISGIAAFIGKFYSAKIYDDSLLVRNFIPVLNVKTGKSGVFDTVNNKFYGDARTNGDFVLPKGYSSTITKVPTNEIDGQRIVKTPQNSDGFIIKMPKLDANQYQIVDCIQSSGNEAIDTRLIVYMSNTHVANLDIQFMNLMTRWGGANGYMQYAPYYFGHCNRFKMRQEFNPGEIGYLLDDDNYVMDVGPWGDYYDCAKYAFFRLGGLNDGWYDAYSQIARLYSADITINGVQKGIYVPVYNVVNNEYGLFDFATDRFLGNCTGNGKLDIPHDYSYSSEINDNNIVYYKRDNLTGESSIINATEIDVTQFNNEEYRLLDYIEATGTQYIDTGVIFNTSETYPIDIYFRAAPEDSSGNNFPLAGNLDSRWSAPIMANFCNNRIEMGTGGYTPVGSYNPGQTYDFHFHSENNYQYGEIDSTILELTSRELVLSDKHLAIGCMNNFYYKGKIYFFKLYSGNKLIRDYVPAVRNIDEKPGLFDLVNNVFYTNSGTGEFLYNDRISSDSIDNYEDIDSITINNENIVKLDERYNDYFIVDALSLDGKKVYPIYSNGYVLGKGPAGQYSSNYELFGLKSYYKNKIIHEYKPVKRLSDSIIGLYDVITNRFLPLFDYYTESPTSYFFASSTYFNKDVAILSAKVSAGMIHADNYFGSYGYDLVSSYKELRDEDGNVIKTESSAVPYELYKKDYAKDGEIYHLYYLFIDGTDGENEWVSNFTIGRSLSGFHKGFEAGADFVLDQIDEFIEDDPRNNKMIISGYSRGAATGSIIASKLLDAGKEFKTKNLSAYCLACPNYSSRTNHYNNIYQICNPGDVVASLPLVTWGFSKEGKQIDLPMDELTLGKVDEKLRYYQELNKIDVVGYTGFTYDVRGKIQKLSSLVSEEDVRNEENSKLLTDLFYAYNEGRDLSIEQIMNVLSKVNFKGNIADVYEGISFINEAQSKLAGSHLPLTYLSWLEVMYL